MYAQCETVKPRPGTTGAALVILAATTTMSMLAPRWIESPSVRMLVAGASVTAGIVAMAWVLAREGRYPRWSFYGAAFVSIAAVFASLLLSGAAWMKEAWPTLLIYPSYFMIFMTSRRRPAPARVAWVPIASALILGAATVLSTRIVHS